MFKSLDKLSRQVTNAIDKVSQDLTQTVNENWSSHLLANFRSGNVVQLISRSSGKALQIVLSVNGMLVIDGAGPVGKEYLHAHWTVLNEGKNIVRLYNQNNYLAIQNGNPGIMQFPDPSCTSRETRFRLHQTGSSVCFESVEKSQQHIGIMPDGSLRTALATGTGVEGQFVVQLIYSPYVAPASVK